MSLIIELFVYLTVITGKPLEPGCYTMWSLFNALLKLLLGCELRPIKGTKSPRLRAQAFGVANMPGCPRDGVQRSQDTT